MSSKTFQFISDREWYYGGLSNDDNIPDGVGVKKESDGSIYYGEWNHNLRHGFGCLCEADGGLVVSDWSEDRASDIRFRIWSSGGFSVFNGKMDKGMPKEGTLLQKDGRIYHGIFTDLKGESFNGEGALLWPDKRIYAGHWKNGGTDIGGVIRRADGRVTGTLSNVRSGYCVKSWPLESEKQFFYGITKDDEVRNAEGILFYNNGIFFAGELSGGQKTGCGILRKEDGSISIGEWVNGNQQGQGIWFRYVDDILDIYFGKIKDDHFDGEGCMFHREHGEWSLVYYGSWKSGKKSGNGFLREGNNGFFVGEFYDDLKNGDGETISPDGERNSMKWKNGFPEVSLQEVRAAGPERITYKKTDNISEAVINSLVDGDEFGDERFFVGIRASADSSYQRTIVVEPGCDYEIRVFFHNDTNSLSDTIKNVRMRAFFSKEISKQNNGIVSASLSADGANPPLIWDSIMLKTSDELSLSYKIASAKIHNCYKSDGHIVPQTLFGDDGAFLGTDALNGELPPDSSGYVTFLIHASGTKSDNSISFTKKPENAVKPAVKRDLSANADQTNTPAGAEKKKKRSRISIALKAADGNGDYVREIAADIGEEIKAVISFTNSASVQDIKISAMLPATIEYVKGSSILSLSNGTRVKQTDDWITGGLILPDFISEGEGSVQFRVRYFPDANASQTEMKMIAEIDTSDITMKSELKIHG